MPSRFTPTRLVDYPWVVVRIGCSMCKRAGTYRLARLAARYGPEQSLDGLLREIASSCPWYNEQPRKYEPRCGACFIDLERNLPPADHPDEPIHRRRQPAREQVPKPTPPNRGPTLAGFTEPRLKHLLLRLECKACGRSESQRLSDLREQFGGDASLARIAEWLTVYCPRRQEPEVYGLCRAMLVQPKR